MLLVWVWSVPRCRSTGGLDGVLCQQERDGAEMVVGEWGVGQHPCQGRSALVSDKRGGANHVTRLIVATCPAPPPLSVSTNKDKVAALLPNHLSMAPLYHPATARTAPGAVKGSQNHVSSRLRLQDMVHVYGITTCSQGTHPRGISTRVMTAVS